MIRNSRALGAIAAVALASVLVATPASAAAKSTLGDLLMGWLQVQEEEPEAWAQAWLKYEAANSRALDQAFYGLYKPEQKAALLDEFLQKELNGLPAKMHGLGQLHQNWESDFEAVKDVMSREFGRAPQLDILLVFSAAPQKITLAFPDNKSTLFLNARFFVPYSQPRLRALFGRHLTPFVKSARPDYLGPNAPIEAQLQAEGLAGLAATRAAPNGTVADWIQSTPEEAARLEAGLTGFARELAMAMESTKPQTERFFGATPPAGWPPFTGRYLALKVAQELGKKYRPAVLMAMDTKMYAEKAKPIVWQLAGRKP